MPEHIRSGNAHEFTTRILTEDGSAWELADCTVVEVIRNLSGDELLEHTLIVNDSGVAIAEDGIELSGDSENGTIIRSLTADETADLEAGWYRYDLDLIDSESNRYDIEDGAWKIVVREESYKPTVGMTRREISRRVLSRLGDLMIITATGDGTMTTFSDRRNLIGEPDAYRGRMIRFTGGTVDNIGEVRYVSGSSRTNRTLTVDDALPAAIAEGDEAEMINFFGLGYRFRDVEDAIDAAVSAAGEFSPEPTFLDVGTFAATSPRIYLPDDWIGVNAVDWQNTETSAWNTAEYTPRMYENGWSVDRSTRSVYIGRNLSTTMDTKTTRIRGIKMPSPIPYPDDRTTINAEWLIARCISELSSAMFRRNPTAEREKMLAYDLQNEQVIRTMTTKRSPMNTVRL